MTRSGLSNAIPSSAFMDASRQPGNSYAKLCRHCRRLHVHNLPRLVWLVVQVTSLSVAPRGLRVTNPSYRRFHPDCKRLISSMRRSTSISEGLVNLHHIEQRSPRSDRVLPTAAGPGLAICSHTTCSCNSNTFDKSSILIILI